LVHLPSDGAEPLPPDRKQRFDMNKGLKVEAVRVRVITDKEEVTASAAAAGGV
jgi:hypothetical protein